MDGAVVDDEVIIAAGAVVPPGKHLAGGQVYAGNPAKALRPLKDKERAFFAYTAGNYVNLKDEYLSAAEAESAVSLGARHASMPVACTRT